ncbi:ABC transporter ATP-binding protein [Clostridium estertheticum]|uniref:ABC transporter ATP-binding protein n=1 Tax=Clostridium estertheticum TaxID=238834 RepID=UPI001C0D06FE|nr:ABC transporter ATP-binding protein [Clostridium estertheticum]MBU3215070.1 ABC transporter ATP-binding protein [Clostridium estertheticum]WAG55642.1 ABC transporter ATP-binding protein [Clostridium estertheticum]
MEDQQYAVEMKSIYKYFDDFCALSSIDLKITKGSIHALLGENGAGKTTLMNILYGLYTPDSGQILISGESVEMKNPNVAIEHKIGMVHQHFKLVGKFTVIENIILGKEVVKAGYILDIAKARNEVKKLSEIYGLDVDPDAKIEDISVGMQQRVEILKALYRGVEILILDEPTAVLTPQEIEELIKIMHNLTEDGKTIIIITHKLKEIKKSSQYCTIIRRGKYIDTVDVKNTTEQELASMMVGREVNLKVKKTKAKPEDVVFTIDNLIVEDSRKIERVKNFSLEVRKGEIVGIAGIDGNGQKELVEAITCLKKVKSGKISINGVELQNTTPHNVIEHGICTIHEDRQKRGLILDFPVKYNFITEKYNKSKFSKHFILNNKAINKFTQDSIKKYDIRPEDCASKPVGALSGGNQQKVVIARELSNDPLLLIAFQPTRGLDVGAIEFVHSTLVKHRDSGHSILLISFELDEIINVADRICVLYDGQIVAEFLQGEVDEKLIGLLMAGGEKKNEI